MSYLTVRTGSRTLPSGTSLLNNGQINDSRPDDDGKLSLGNDVCALQDFTIEKCQENIMEI